MFNNVERADPMTPKNNFDKTPSYKVNIEGLCMMYCWKSNDI